MLAEVHIALFSLVFRKSQTAFQTIPCVPIADGAQWEPKARAANGQQSAEPFLIEE